MAFHSWQFGVFLGLVLCVFWAVAGSRRARNLVLLAGSYWFYGSWNVAFLGLLAFSTVLDYFCGRAMVAREDDAGRKQFLLLSLLGNLGLLGYFKYTYWGSELFEGLVQFVGLDISLFEYAWAVHDGSGWIEKAVPVGISFYTFQTLSYTIDIYRRRMAPAKSFEEFALFVAFFPQLVAGPIVRAADFIPQLELKPRFTRARVHDGLYRIGVGLAKKGLFADQLGYYLVNPVYDNPGDYAWWVHMLALYGFTFQIYYDFAGYSDIAIGSARLFGFDLPENFVGPYQSQSVREFWRRWHITLSTWVRDYIYFPLGGSKGNELFVCRNLMITMITIGLWHGASVLWVLYGVCQGTAMILERWWERMRGGALFATTGPKKLLSWFLTFHFIVLTCLFIRGTSMAQIGDVLWTYGERTDMGEWAWWALGLGAAIHFIPMPRAAAFKRRCEALPTPVLALLLGALSGALIAVMTNQANFIYFQF